MLYMSLKNTFDWILPASLSIKLARLFKGLGLRSLSRKGLEINLKASN
jgi:hypothetical protein